MRSAGKWIACSLAHSNASTTEMVNDDTTLDGCNGGGYDGRIATPSAGLVVAAAAILRLIVIIGAEVERGIVAPSAKVEQR